MSKLYYKLTKEFEFDYQFSGLRLNLHYPRLSLSQLFFCFSFSKMVKGYLLTGDEGGIFRIWDIEEGTVLKVMHPGKSINEQSFTNIYFINSSYKNEIHFG